MDVKTESLGLGNESLPQVKEFKYLGVLLMSEGTMKMGTGQRIGAAGAVLCSLYHTVVMKRELSQKAKLLIYWSVSLHSYPYLWSLRMGHDRKNEIAGTSS